MLTTADVLEPMRAILRQPLYSASRQCAPLRMRAGFRARPVTTNGCKAVLSTLALVGSGYRTGVVNVEANIHRLVRSGYQPGGTSVKSCQDSTLEFPHVYGIRVGSRVDFVELSRGEFHPNKFWSLGFEDTQT